MQLRFKVEGMSCTACSASVERVVKRIDGVTRADVNLIAKILICEFDETKASSADIISAVAKAGFSATEESPVKVKTASNVQVADKQTDGLPSVKLRLIASLCLLAPLMYLAMGNMLGAPIPGFLSPANNPVAFAFAEFLLATPVLYLNRKFFINGIRMLLRRAPNMDTLVATGSLAAYVYGIFAIFMIAHGVSSDNGALVDRYIANLYFESSAMILTLITIGKAIEEKAKSRTGSAVELLKKLAPTKATVRRNGLDVEVDTADIVIGDLVVIKNGSGIPIDGIVVEGGSYVDEAALTGESVPVYKGIGDNVLSASTCTDGYLVLKATAVGADTTLSKIIDLVRDAGATKAPIAKLADKISGIFVPVVMGLALVTLIVWLCIGAPFETALTRAVSVLVISCPCALGLATPVAVTASIGTCAKKGILIKSAEAFELLARTDTVIMDKTGTITEGKPAVNGIATANGIDEQTLISYAVTLEQMSSHPLARAILDYGASAKVLGAADYINTAGSGVSCIIDGAVFRAGNKSFLETNGIDLSELPEFASSQEAIGSTLIWLAKDSSLIGAISVRDKVKKNARNAVISLKDKGLTVAMLSGDSAAACNAVKSETDIDVAYSGILPDGKEKIVSEVQQASKTVVFVGDGINDSPALARADVGIAIGGGTAIAIDAAEVVLMRDDISDVGECISIGRRTLKIIKENLFWAFFYNVICIPLAAGAFAALGVVLNPMIAAAAMSVSSLFVVTNALRLKQIKKKKGA